MDPSTASYYRAILFTDGLDTRPLPPTLLQLHGWAVKRHLALGLGGIISKAIALNVTMTWLSTTKEGREFTRENTMLGDFFALPPVEEQESVTGSNLVDWDAVSVGREVLVTLSDNKTTKIGSFVECRGNWLDVRVDGELKHFKTSKVQLVGA